MNSTTRWRGRSRTPAPRWSRWSRTRIWCERYARVQRVQIAPDGVHAAVLAASRGDAEFGEDVPEVRLHGAPREEEPLGDRGVGQAVRDEREDFALAQCEHAAQCGSVFGPGPVATPARSQQHP